MVSPSFSRVTCCREQRAYSVEREKHPSSTLGNLRTNFRISRGKVPDAPIMKRLASEPLGFAILGLMLPLLMDPHRKRLFPTLVGARTRPGKFVVGIKPSLGDSAPVDIG